MEIHVGGEIHRLHNLMCRDVNRFPSGDLVDSMTGSHGFILCWLNGQKNGDVFQKDLEKRFQLRRSSATAMLQVMERNGLIRREAVASDARLKKLVITPKGAELCRMIHDDIEENERRLVKGFSEEELLTLQSLLQKLRGNLERGLYTEDAAQPQSIPQGKEGNETR